MSGLPAGDLGRIGLNYSPVNPDVLFAVVKAADGEGGVYKSKDRVRVGKEKARWLFNFELLSKNLLRSEGH